MWLVCGAWLCIRAPECFLLLVIYWQVFNDLHIKDQQTIAVFRQHRYFVLKIRFAQSCTWMRWPSQQIQSLASFNRRFDLRHNWNVCTTVFQLIFIIKKPYCAYFETSTLARIEPMTLMLWVNALERSVTRARTLTSRRRRRNITTWP